MWSRCTVTAGVVIGLIDDVNNVPPHIVQLHASDQAVCSTCTVIVTGLSGLDPSAAYDLAPRFMGEQEVLPAPKLLGCVDTTFTPQGCVRPLLFHVMVPYQATAS